MTWRIKLKEELKGVRVDRIVGSRGAVYEMDDYLRKNGQICEFSTKEECLEAIKILEKADLISLTHLLEPVKV